MNDDGMAMQQLRMRQTERRQVFDETQDGIRRQKELLQSLRRENKELRSSLQVASRGGTVSSGRYSAQEAQLLDTKLYRLRRQLDALKFENDKSSENVVKMEETTRGLDLEAQPIFSDKDPIAQKIRALENRLDKSLIRYNEAISIRRTYESILERLEEERIGFDNQLAAIEKTLKAKEVDFNELKNMAHDAMHAKETARTKLEDFKRSYQEERRQKKKELEERNSYVTAKVEQMQKQERQLKARRLQEEQAAAAKPSEEEERKAGINAIVAFQTEEEQRRLMEHSENIRRLKELTHTTSKAGILQRYQEQRETNEDLRKQRVAVQSRLEQLMAHRSELQRKLEAAKYSGVTQLGSRRVVDEFEVHLAESQQHVESATVEYEDVSKLLTSVRAGIEQLAEKLSIFRPEIQPPALMDDVNDNTVEVLRHCEAKLLMLIEELAQYGEGVSVPAELSPTAVVDVPQHNVRVATTIDAADDLNDFDERRDRVEGDGEEDPHSRDELKQMAHSAVERETKKARKRGRMKDSDV